MENWKKAIVIGSLTAGALLAIKGKKTPALVVSTTGLALLAAEYPEKFESLWEYAPRYVTSGMQIFAALTQVAERFVEDSSRRSLPPVWDEA